MLSLGAWNTFILSTFSVNSRIVLIMNIFTSPQIEPFLVAKRVRYTDTGDLADPMFVVYNYNQLSGSFKFDRVRTFALSSKCYYYRPHPKDREDNVFTGVCPFTRGGGTPVPCSFPGLWSQVLSGGTPVLAGGYPILAGGAPLS